MCTGDGERLCGGLVVLRGERDGHDVLTKCQRDIVHKELAVDVERGELPIDGDGGVRRRIEAAGDDSGVVIGGAAIEVGWWGDGVTASALACPMLQCPPHGLPC